MPGVFYLNFIGKKTLPALKAVTRKLVKIRAQAFVFDSYTDYDNRLQQ